MEELSALSGSLHEPTQRSEFLQHFVAFCNCDVDQPIDDRFVKLCSLVSGMLNAEAPIELACSALEAISLFVPLLHHTPLSQFHAVVDLLTTSIEQVTAFSWYIDEQLASALRAQGEGASHDDVNDALQILGVCVTTACSCIQALNKVWAAHAPQHSSEDCRRLATLPESVFRFVDMCCVHTKDYSLLLGSTKDMFRDSLSSLHKSGIDLFNMAIDFWIALPSSNLSQESQTFIFSTLRAMMEKTFALTSSSDLIVLNTMWKQLTRLLSTHAAILPALRFDPQAVGNALLLLIEKHLQSLKDVLLKQDKPAVARTVKISRFFVVQLVQLLRADVLPFECCIDRFIVLYDQLKSMLRSNHTAVAADVTDINGLLVPSMEQTFVAFCSSQNRLQTLFSLITTTKSELKNDDSNWSRFSLLLTLTQHVNELPTAEPLLEDMWQSLVLYTTRFYSELTASLGGEVTVYQRLIFSFVALCNALAGFEKQNIMSRVLILCCDPHITISQLGRDLMVILTRHYNESQQQALVTTIWSAACSLGQSDHSLEAQGSLVRLLTLLLDVVSPPVVARFLSTIQNLLNDESDVQISSTMVAVKLVLTNLHDFPSSSSATLLLLNQILQGILNRLRSMHQVPFESIDILLAAVLFEILASLIKLTQSQTNQLKAGSTLAVQWFGKLLKTTTNQLVDHYESGRLFIAILKVCAVTATVMSGPEVCGILAATNGLFKKQDQIRYVFTKFVGGLGAVSVGSNLQSQFCKELKTSFSLFFSSDNWMIFHSGLQAFADFAKLSPLDITSLLPEPAEQSQNFLVNLLQRIPFSNGSSKPDAFSQLVHEEQTLFEHSQNKRRKLTATNTHTCLPNSSKAPATSDIQWINIEQALQSIHGSLLLPNPTEHSSGNGFVSSFQSAVEENEKFELLQSRLRTLLQYVAQRQGQLYGHGQ